MLGSTHGEQITSSTIADPGFVVAPVHVDTVGVQKLEGEDSEQAFAAVAAAVHNVACNTAQGKGARQTRVVR